VKGFCESAGADAAPKRLASGSPKVAILFLLRHLAQSRALFAVALAAFGQMAPQSRCQRPASTHAPLHVRRV